LQDQAYLSNRTSEWAKYLQEDTRQMTLYFNNVLGQMEFRNILF
jgi:hypothetical protein